MYNQYKLNTTVKHPSLQCTKVLGVWTKLKKYNKNINCTTDVLINVLLINCISRLLNIL